MDYKNTVPFDGNPKIAIDAARNTLSAHGFSESHIDGNSLEMKRSDAFGKGMSALSAISSINISVSEYGLSVKAEFGGIRKTMKFMIMMVLLLMLIFMTIFSVWFGIASPEKVKHVLYLVPLVFAPWLVLIPVMVRIFMSRTSETLDSLLVNILVSREV